MVAIELEQLFSCNCSRGALVQLETWREKPEKRWRLKKRRDGWYGLQLHCAAGCNVLSKALGERCSQQAGNKVFGWSISFAIILGRSNVIDLKF